MYLTVDAALAHYFDVGPTRLPMKTALGLVFATMLATNAKAAEVKVLCVGGVQSAIPVLIPQYERASGFKVAVSYVSPGGALRDRVLSDKDVDVAFVPSPVLDDVARAGKIVPGTLVEIARTPLAVGVRSGAPKRDLNTPEAVKRVIIDAKSVALSDPKANSPIGIYFMRVAERFGFGSELKARTVLIQGGGVAVARAVAAGKAELTVTLMSEILTVQGVEVAGPLPHEMQNVIVTSAVLVPGGREPTGGKALIDFLRTPAAVAVFRAKGQDPFYSSK